MIKIFKNRKVKELEEDVAYLKNLVLNHIGDGGDVHALAEDGLPGFISGEEKFMIHNSSGRRAWVTGLDFNTIESGKYEGNYMKNGPIEDTNNGVLIFDVSEGENNRRYITCVKSSSGQSWTKVVHSSGVVSQDWMQSVKAFRKSFSLTPNPSLTTTQKNAISAHCYLIQLPNLMDIVNIRITLDKGVIPKNGVSPITIIKTLPDEIVPGVGFKDPYPSIINPTNTGLVILGGVPTADSKEFIINFNSANDLSGEAFQINKMYLKEPSINIK